jgi:hypothetical protein
MALRITQSVLILNSIITNCGYDPVSLTMREVQMSHFGSGWE